MIQIRKITLYERQVNSLFQFYLSKSLFYPHACNFYYAHSSKRIKFILRYNNLLEPKISYRIRTPFFHPKYLNALPTTDCYSF